MNLASPSTRIHSSSLLADASRRAARPSPPGAAHPAAKAKWTSTYPPVDDLERQKNSPPHEDDGGRTKLEELKRARLRFTQRSRFSRPANGRRDKGQAESSRSNLPRTIWTLVKTQMKYLGPGITMSVAYCDPGNWATDLQAGSQFGYPLLFIILLTGIFGIVLQVLALRMGIVCNKDLAVLTREWALSLGKTNRLAPTNPAPVSSTSHGIQDDQGSLQAPSTSRMSLWAQRGRVALLWSLYLVAEGAIICTELAELVGSAIALNLLFPALPLWGGVLITSADVFLILLIYKPNTKSLRYFEFFVGLLVLIVLSCLVALVVRVKPHWPSVFRGYLPSSAIVRPQPLYVAIGILGATVMPHGLFLGSHFSCFEREGENNKEDRIQNAVYDAGNEEDVLDNPDAINETRHVSQDLIGTTSSPLARRLRGFCFLQLRAFDSGDLVAGDRENNTPACHHRSSSFDKHMTSPPPRDLLAIKRRVVHSTIDVAVSMILFALTTNSALLIIASQAFYFGIEGSSGDHGGIVVGDLFQAFELIKERLNHVFAILFAVALLASGQSASITVTLAGQIISEGMIKWRTNPFLRRCLTRGITLIPAFTVAAGIGRAGLDELLVASQVALSMALPFVLLPLLAITASKRWMKAEVLPPPTLRTVEDEGEDFPGHVEGSTPAPALVTSPLTSPQQPQHRFLKSTSLLRWSWWTRGAGKVEQEGQQGQTSAATRGLGSMRLTTHFANGWILILATSAIYVIICISDVYVIVTTAMGIGG